MKRWKRFVHGILTLGIISLFLFIAACEDDPVAPQTRYEPIDLIKIISNPLAPAPGDEVTLTAQAVGYSSRWPGYYWEVEAGSLLTDQKISVYWKAPDSTCTVRVTVRASTAQDADLKSHVRPEPGLRVNTPRIRYLLLPRLRGVQGISQPYAASLPGPHERTGQHPCGRKDCDTKR